MAQKGADYRACPYEFTSIPNEGHLIRSTEDIMRVQAAGGKLALRQVSGGGHSPPPHLRRQM